MHVSLAKFIGAAMDDAGRCHRGLFDSLLRCVGVPLEGDLNLWVTTQWVHTTPLHYDDHHNLLWVIEGRKRIVFLPPDSSAQLLPTVVRPSIASFVADPGVAYDLGKRG